MAIQHRRGAYANLDPTKAVPGEVLVVLQDDPTSDDGKAAYMTFAAGDIKRMATYDEVEHFNEESKDYADDAKEYRDDAQSALTTIQSLASQVSDDADTVSDAVTSVTSTASAAISSIDSAKNTALGGIETAAQSGMNSISSAITVAFSDIQSKIDELADPFIKVQDTQPVEENNKIWVKETPQAEVSVPTYEEFNEVKSALSCITGVTPIQVTAKKKYVALNGSSVTMSDGYPVLSGDSASYDVSIVSCQAGDKFTLNGVGGTSTRLWGFISSDGTILSVASAGASGTNLIVTAPTNTAYLISHTNDGRTSYIGEIVSSQINDIRNSCSGTLDSATHGFSLDEISFSDNTAIATADGAESSNGSYWITDYIDISSVPNGYLYANATIYKVACYDSSKNFVSVPVTSDRDHFDTRNYAYCKLQFKKSDVPVGQRPFIIVNISENPYPYELNSELVYVGDVGIDLIPYSIGVYKVYMQNAETPSLVYNNENWQTYIFKSDDIKVFTLVNGCANTDTGYILIAFYSDSSFSSESLVSVITYDNVPGKKLARGSAKNIVFPAGAKYCLIFNRKTTGDLMVKGILNRPVLGGLDKNLYKTKLTNLNVESSSGDYWVTDYLPIEAGKTNIYSKYPIYKALFLDSNKSVISTYETHDSIIVPINTSAVYCRIQYKLANADFWDERNYVVEVTDVSSDTNPVVIIGNLLNYLADTAYRKTISIPYNTINYRYSGEKIDLSHGCMMKQLGYSGNGQDACQYGNYLFAFNNAGSCKVVDTTTAQTVATFTVDQYDTIKPHCNSAVFSKAFHTEGDVFPLMYINAYNTTGLPLGTCYVHRILTDENDLPTGTTLVQTITVGFTDSEPWTDGSDVRPYGNFFVDTDNNYLYAYTIKDSAKVTRFFKFAVPALSSSSVTLTTNDILEQFDVPHIPYIQGNTFKDGKVYILSGFGTSANPGFLNVVNVYSHSLVTKINFKETFAKSWEPEFINVVNDKLVIGQTTAFEFAF